ncbi:IS66 family transposase, partial [Halorhodospira halochloris]|uniref:IS66 family transposase n=1 Tax=Halorhodospira halochloris TaxID=1052 RepID=UPI001EE83F45
KSASLLEPIYRAMRDGCLSRPVLLMDETPGKAGRKGKGKMHQGQFWCIYAEPGEICFTYSHSRGKAQIEKILGDDFQGVLLTDGYAAYEKFAAAMDAVTHAQCWAHTRRGFEGALKKEPQTDEVLELIGRLYKIEKSIREHNLDGEAKLEVRRKYSQPIVSEIWQWCQNILKSGREPKNPLIKAAKYALQRKQELEVFLSNADVPLDTNDLERGLRPIPLGRKAWLFCWSEVGAHWVAIIQSLITTCRMQGINPHTYLTDVLQRVGTHPNNRVEELTPRRWKELFADNPMGSDIDGWAPT